MIQTRNLNVRYGNIPAFREINLEIEQGECILVTGPSGSGKSTLGRVLCGLIPHAIPAQVEGEILVSGMDILNCTIPVIAQKVGMVFQRPATQLFHLKVEDEVAFGPRNLCLEEADVRERTDWALEATGLTQLRTKRTTELSGGQKQCLAIAAVLAMKPGVLVLDEPTASLDVPNTRRVIDALAYLRSILGITIILIEHRLAEASQIVGRVILMENGQIVSDANSNEVFGDFELRNRLGLRRPTEEPSITWQELIKANGVRANESPALLAMESVSAGFNGRAVIHDIQLKLDPGEFVALVGDNGAGKSTLAMVAAGLLKPQSGKLYFDHNRRPKPGLDVAMLFQDPEDQLFTDSVEEEVAFGASNYGCFEPGLHRQTLIEADLWELRSRQPRAISVGQQQRTALAACLNLRPRLLILDEPTLGQDWGHLQRLMNYLLLLNKQGMAILLISHDYKLVHRYARRVILMKDGRIERTGRFQDAI